MNRILECVPNFSEGCNTATINAIANAISSIPEVYLLDIDSSPAANRTVYSFAGTPERVIDAAFASISTAQKHIDMRIQAGVHPRIGVMDVCPLIPLANVTLEEANRHAHALAQKIGSTLATPIFLYEESQNKPYRKYLPQIRKGQYEGMAQKITDPLWQPDYGPSTFNTRTGATVLGVRKILVAFNISLQTNDLKVAEQIANAMRSINKQSAHRLPQLRAIAWHMADYNQVQVSFNLLDYTITSPLAVWLKCQELAHAFDTELIGSELIGLMPAQCLLEAGRYLHPEEADTDQIIKNGVQLLRLNQIKPFDHNKKILEYNLQLFYPNLIDLNT